MLQKQRKLVQTLSLLALHSSWGPEVKWLCNPVLSCHSCVLAWFACPIGIFVHYSAYQAFPFLAAGTVLLLGTLIGRLLCGWVCPFGFLQELLHKIPTRKLQLPEWTSYIKYAVLVLMVFLFPYFLGEDSLLVFCRYCPASALQVSLPYLLGGGTISIGTLIKLAVTALILLVVIVFERGFCKLLCPIGALLAPLNLLCFWTVKVPSEDCLACGQCDSACPTNVQPSKRIDQGIPASRALDCIVCHECQVACPQVEDPSGA